MGYGQPTMQAGSQVGAQRQHCAGVQDALSQLKDVIDAVASFRRGLTENLVAEKRCEVPQSSPVFASVWVDLPNQLTAMAAELRTELDALSSMVHYAR